MCETDEADGEKVASNKEANLNISQPAPEAVVDGDLSLPFTPPTSEIILKVCENSGNDTPGSLSHGMTDSTEMNPSKSDSESANDPIHLLDLEMEVDEDPGSYHPNL